MPANKAEASVVVAASADRAVAVAEVSVAAEVVR